MEKSKKQTFYFRRMGAMKTLASEENLDVNGSLFESIFFDRFCGTDPNFNRILTDLYSEDVDLRHTLAGIVELMAFDPNYRQPENLGLIRVIRDIVGASDLADRDDNPTDYRLFNKAKYVDALADIYAVLNRELDQRIELADSDLFRSNDVKPWAIDVRDNWMQNILSDEASYSEEARTKLKQDEAILRAQLIEANKPGDILSILIDHWEDLWIFKSTYEAVIFCVELASELTDLPLLRKQLREAILQICATKGAVNVTFSPCVSTLEQTQKMGNRLAAYANKLKQI